MYKCPGCGAALRFDPKSQMMVCDHCRTTLSPKDEALTHLNESLGQNAVGEVTDQDGKLQTIVYTCPNCGGTILSTDSTAVTFCNYCDSSVMLEGRLEAQDAPDVIIPFKLGKEECKESYRRLLKRAVFAPNYLKKDTEIEKFRGIYMPYWIYAFAADGDTAGSGSTSHRSGNYIITDHFRINRYIHSRYSGLSYDASADFSDVMSEAVAPFRTIGAEPFLPSYMSGFYADVGDVDKEVYEGDARSVAVDYMAEETVKDVAYPRHGVTSASVIHSIPIASEPKRKGYFPVWFLANRIPGKDMITYAVVNGETGKIAADLPVAFWKYLLASVLLAVPLFLILNLVFTLTPKAALIANIVLSAVMIFVLSSMYNRAYERQHGIDRGMQNRLSKLPQAKPEETSKESLKKAKEKVRKEEKKKTKSGCLKAFLWIVFGFAAFLLFGYLSTRMHSEVAFYLIAGFVVLIAMIASIASDSRTKKAAASKQGAPAAKKMPYLILPILAIALSVLVLILHPVDDFWYYGAAAVSELFLIWCAFNAVKLHNQATSRPLPQFNKRGGVGK